MDWRTGEWTQAKFEGYIKEGRGKGSGKDYKPWHRVSFSSQSLAKRVELRQLTKLGRCNL
jgi:hypothetical protein